MEIKAFLELCTGKWFSQRSSYHFESQKPDSGKAELTVEWLDSSHPEVISLCQTHHLDPQCSLGGQKVRWETIADWGESAKQTGTTLLIFVSDPENDRGGQLLRTPLDNSASVVTGCYELGTDEALTLMLDNETYGFQERIWFASPNLRLRTSLIKNPQGYHRTAFYSEIRKVAS